MQEGVKKTLKQIEQAEDVFELNEASFQSKEPIKSKFASIPRATGKLLYSLVLTKGARNILEIGSSVGYSTLWLASAALETHGQVTSLEISTERAEMAKQHLQNAGLHNIHHLNTDAFVYLKDNPNLKFDFVFIDSFKKDYPGLLTLALLALDSKGIIIFDNILSHSKLETFVQETEERKDLDTQLLPFDNGLLIIHKK